MNKQQRERFNSEVIAGLTGKTIKSVHYVDDADAPLQLNRQLTGYFVVTLDDGSETSVVTMAELVRE